MSSNMKAPDIDTRLRSLRIIWAAILGTIFLYAALGYFESPPILSWRVGFAGEDGSAALGLTAGVLYLVGLLAAVGASQLLLRSFLRRAEAEQNPALVQTGFIVAFVFCEAGALIGLVILFMTRSWVAFLLMAISAMMVAILFPRREQVAAAGYKI
jgi:F0F1-type ATP synthase membrane subunit c/vacuolar-type H+-ATPase subunit K